jgi:putative peptide maturation dehydrogenase
VPRVRRSVYVFFHCQDQFLPDFGAFFRGEVRGVANRQIYAISLLRGEELPVSSEEVEIAFSIPAHEWVADDRQEVAELARKGVLVSDADDGELRRLRTRDEQLASTGWNLYGALHYLMTKWGDISMQESVGDGEFPVITEESIAEFVEQRGRPPDPWVAVENPLATTALPLAERGGQLYEVLASRKTTRGFDRSRRMTVEELATVLHQVWGCHGTVPIVDDLLCIKRTSPSGGGLHPIEVYPLVSGVDGVEPGLYHYNVRDHSLELIERIPEDEAVALAGDFACGQRYFGTAHVSFVMTARFPRSHWKYRRQQKAYPVILMDAAHLSQTHYLVATELGLGAYVTIAINTLQIEERLGLDGIAEGVVAMAGCGKQRPEGSPFEPRFTPYEPRGGAGAPPRSDSTSP